MKLEEWIKEMFPKKHKIFKEIDIIEEYLKDLNQTEQNYLTILIKSQEFDTKEIF